MVTHAAGSAAAAGVDNIDTLTVAHVGVVISVRVKGLQTIGVGAGAGSSGCCGAALPSIPITTTTSTVSCSACVKVGIFTAIAAVGEGQPVGIAVEFIEQLGPGPLQCQLLFFWGGPSCSGLPPVGIQTQASALLLAFV